MRPAHLLPASIVSHGRRPHRRHGYALLLVLVVLALAGTLLGLIAQRSASRAKGAFLAERALQTRWGLASCEGLLNRAEELLVETDEAGRPRAAGARTFQFQLGDRRATVVLADEQAKPNLNILAGRLNSAPLTNLLRRRMQGAPIALWPLAGDRPFICWEQVMPGWRPADSRAQADRAHPTGFTLWGDGKFRLATATPQACEDFLGTDLTSDQISQLRANVGQGMSIKDAAALLPRTARAVADRLTDDCKARSAWITLEAPVAGDRTAAPLPESRLIVVTPEERTQVRRFCWP